MLLANVDVLVGVSQVQVANAHYRIAVIVWPNQYEY